MPAVDAAHVRKKQIRMYLRTLPWAVATQYGRPPRQGLRLTSSCTRVSPSFRAVFRVCADLEFALRYFDARSSALAPIERKAGAKWPDAEIVSSLPDCCSHTRSPLLSSMRRHHHLIKISRLLATIMLGDRVIA